MRGNEVEEKTSNKMPKPSKAALEPPPIPDRSSGKVPIPKRTVK
jgi:hypothetical protein